MPMKVGSEPFKSRVDEGIQNTFMRGAVSGAQDRLEVNRLKAVDELGDWETWRLLGEQIRQHVLENLDYYLTQLSDNVAKLGGNVYFASTAEEARDYILSVAKQKGAKKIVKSKSMVTEEIDLNHHLLANGLDVVETDLGEYILQLDNDLPSHIVAPALHRNKEQVQESFHHHHGYEGSSRPEDLTKHARKMLRNDYLTADIGITGCNFAVAETGSVCIVTNEGNADLSTSLPPTQITVMGMERLVPTFEELEVLVNMLTRSAVGQKLPSYVTVLSGPRHEDEIDGPEEFHLVIVDNGRSEIVGTEFQSILQCIRCGACANVCPVYRHVGGHSYGSIYSGPVGAVLSPLLGGYDDYKELPFASTLCGACTDVCPVKIPLHELLHQHRQVIVEKEGRTPLSERFLMSIFGMGSSSSGLYNMGSKIASKALKPIIKDSHFSKGVGPLKNWMEAREFPAPNKERFRDWFENRSKGGNGS
ncbi:LutB/LldF family L-lactate oxidation iron-sulfur protein [Neobacillus sp. OS1-2]|uniref:LutB/LldF family L-lactate oxidation iron-sulfur protein n=1 Tax=Neobacillus sp. OS1-2 TaxID=3070680 RepID=UPI0027DEACF5|nr:LutB/LldF family L-lactate oxidation iron-sulfur protein [Neobacillus sp. OS1-2]WML41426.1 LutB/LldF family L-lactate oxidation iron-sulfur protein [Neobacillus sp. OS1-2]